MTDQLTEDPKEGEPTNRFSHWATDILVEMLRGIANNNFEQGSEQHDKVYAAADRLDALYVGESGRSPSPAAPELVKAAQVALEWAANFPLGEPTGAGPDATAAEDVYNALYPLVDPSVGRYATPSSSPAAPNRSESPNSSEPVPETREPRNFDAPEQQTAPASPTKQHRRKCPALYGSACTCVTPRQICEACGKAYDLIRSDFGPVTAYGEFWRIPNCTHCNKEPTGIALEGPKPAKSNDEVYHDDVVDLLRALGMSDSPRSYSAHEVLQRDILPNIRGLICGKCGCSRGGPGRAFSDGTICDEGGLHSRPATPASSGEPSAPCKACNDEGMVCTHEGDILGPCPMCSGEPSEVEGLPLNVQPYSDAEVCSFTANAQRVIAYRQKYPGEDDGPTIREVIDGAEYFQIDGRDADEAESDLRWVATLRSTLKAKDALTQEIREREEGRLAIERLWAAERSLREKAEAERDEKAAEKPEAYRRGWNSGARSALSDLREKVKHMPVLRFPVLHGSTHWMAEHAAVLALIDASLHSLTPTEP